MSPAGFAHRASDGKWVCPKHLAYLNEKLTLVAAGRIKRLLIAMPPRHGKSEFTSKYFPAWYLGTFPDRRVVLASYEADFAAGWGRKVRDILQEHGKRYFGVTIRQDSSAADRWDIVGRDGGMNTAGVGGPLTGRGAHLLIIDDPVKNSEEANSPTYRAKAWDWYTSTAYTRLEPDGAVILIQTRWHEDDLAGKILASSQNSGESWTVVCLPALAEQNDPLGRQPGEALWPARYSSERLLEIQRTQDDPAAGQVRHWFDALYQQHPVPAEGGAFKRQWFRYWTSDTTDCPTCHKQPRDPHQPPCDYCGGDGVIDRFILKLKDRPAKVVNAPDCRRFGTVDLAFSQRKEADYTVIAAWAVTPHSELILLDLVRERMEGPDIVPAIERIKTKHGLAYVGIEEVSAQLLVVQAARRAGLAVRGLKADRDKVSRAIPATIRMEGELVFFPERAAWLSAFEAELLTFPKGAHDDQVDAFAYAALEVQKRGGSGPSRDERKSREIATQQMEAEKQQEWLNPMNPAFYR